MTASCVFQGLGRVIIWVHQRGRRDSKRKELTRENGNASLPTVTQQIQIILSGSVVTPDAAIAVLFVL